ncbi:MAG: protein-L-isoaspartate O-methyltransferase, partial [Bacteroidetes bacterium SW_10_40_5]
MVNNQIKARGIEDQDLLGVMKNTPRHQFVPEEYKALAYRDRPLPIGHDQTISQPYIVALMTELLALNGQQKVLEIGTGSGYQASILAQLADQVYTIEIVEALA